MGRIRKASGSLWRGTLAALVLLAVAAPLAAARMVDPVVDPPGPVVAILTAAYVNQELIDQGRATPQTLPFETGTLVDEVRLSREDYYVRFYTYDPSRLKGGGVGSWLMRASSVRGLTMAQVADKFALPTLPDYLIAVRVPTGTVVRSGVAGPISGWGEGGGQQILLVNRISADYYVFGRPNNGPALYYGPWVRGGNPGSMAAYLDTLATPLAYSDLDYVFNRLNFLEPSPLGQAMRAMGPEAYNTMVELSLQDSLLFLDGLAQRRRQLRDATGAKGQPSTAGYLPWARALGVSGDYEDSDDRVGFGYNMGGLAGGFDWALGQRTLLGLAVGYSRANFDWAAGKGDGHADHLNLGLQANYDGGAYFVEGALLGGLRDASTNRNIVFDGVNRTAQGSPDGQVMALQLGGGLNYQWADWKIQPLVALTYAYSHQNDFSETQADSLNLKLDDYDAATLVGRLELRVGRQFVGDGGLKLRPELGLAWLHTAPLDDRTIHAALVGQPGGFSVEGFSANRDSFAPSLELQVETPGGLAVYGRYDGQLDGVVAQHALQAGVIVPF